LLKTSQILCRYGVGRDGFSLRVIRRKNWGKKGKRKKITANGGGRVNVMGGMRDVCMRCVFFIKKGDGDIFMSSYSN